MAEPKKDYLSSLASEIEKKPDSFKEEKVERIVKPKRSVDPKIMIGAAAALIIAIIGVYFLFFAPKIKVENFVGKTTNDVGIWAKENGIDTKNIVMNQVYSMDYDADQIISQNKKEGSKIKKDSTLIFEVSKGADPDEKIEFPDIKNMTLSEINDWISKNKLLKVKVNTVYSDTVEKDQVISFDLKSVNENNFTRGTNPVSYTHLVNRPTLVFAHNKTLAGQLYSEFKALFPHNRVEYFVSNFDYSQPEA